MQCARTVPGWRCGAPSLTHVLTQKAQRPFAGLLMGMQVPQARVIASVTFIAILVTILVQATTTRWLAGKLSLLEE